MDVSAGKLAVVCRKPAGLRAAGNPEHSGKATAPEAAAGTVPGGDAGAAGGVHHLSGAQRL